MGQMSDTINHQNSYGAVGGNNYTPINHRDNNYQAYKQQDMSHLSDDDLQFFLGSQGLN